MWKSYREIAQRYTRIPLTEERRLISKAQKGSKKSKDEIVLRHIGFLIFRIRKIAVPFGEASHGLGLTPRFSHKSWLTRQCFVAGAWPLA